MCGDTHHETVGRQVPSQRHGVDSSQRDGLERDVIEGQRGPGGRGDRGGEREAVRCRADDVQPFLL